MSRHRRLLIAAGLLVPAILLVYILNADSVEQRFPARADGTLSVDLVLGSGISFDRGSLEIRAHEAEDVRVVTTASGWGKYAVDVEASERRGDVQVVGRVEGPLHWMFSGPTVDVQVWVPDGYAVDASIEGGPLRLEDLTGGVRARSTEGGSNSIMLRRVEGIVKLVSAGGGIDVEGVDGALKIEQTQGAVSISGVNGTTVVSAERGGNVAIERIVGDVHVATPSGNIALDKIAGDVDIETDDASVVVKALSGRIDARTRHGDIAVEFLGSPSGAIETRAGSIAVEVPTRSSFDLAVESGSGGIDLDEDLAFVRQETPDVALGPILESNLADAAEMGLEIAAEVGDKVLARVHRELRRHRQRRHPGMFDMPTDPGALDPDGDAEWAWNWSWDDPDWKWRDHEWDFGPRQRWSDWNRQDGNPEGKGETLVGEVNGGGAFLHLSSRAGRIKIED